MIPMKTDKRIENKTSRTAEFTCMIRAGSFYEKRSQYKCDDYIAPTLLPNFFSTIIKIGFLRKLFIGRLYPKGMYEYVIARTKFIDEIFKNSLINGTEQILIFGAGFDSRGIRFNDMNKKTKIFELDAPVTQEAKINQLKKRGVKINSNIIFVPIDFNKESIEERLQESGFKTDKKTLFILEGLTMYLNPEAMDNTFKVIHKISGNDSEVVFDYVYLSVLRGENLFYGEKDILKEVNKADEPWNFGIEKGELDSFLKMRKFHIIKELNSKDLEEKFFKDDQEDILAKINGTHCLVHARKI